MPCCADASPPAQAQCGMDAARPGEFPSLDCDYTSLTLESGNQTACNIACLTGGFALCSYDSDYEYCYGWEEGKSGGCKSYDDTTSTTLRWTLCNGTGAQSSLA
jgi:hypothetical protein